MLIRSKAAHCNHVFDIYIYMSTLRIEWPCNKRGQLQKSEERGKVASTNLIRYQNKDCTFADCKVKGNCFFWQGIDKVLVRLRGGDAIF